MATNPAVPFWDEGNTITCHATEAVTGKRFVTVSGARVDGNPAVSHQATAANNRPLGVSGYDAADEAKVSVYTGPGIVMPVTAGVAITAGDDVVSLADGRATNVIPAGVTPAGMALDDAAVGVDCPVRIA